MSRDAIRRAARAASAAEAAAATVADSIALKHYEGAFAKAMIEDLVEKLSPEQRDAFDVLRPAVIFLEVADGRPMTALELLAYLAGDAKLDRFEDPNARVHSLELLTDARRTIARESDDAEMLN